jgi:hypothetical protein
MKKFALFSSDRNPNYHEFSSICKKFWRMTGYTPIHISIGSTDFPLIEGIPSSLLAQICRMYAAKHFPNAIVLTTDIDMLPLNKEYFNSKLPKNENEVVVYSSDMYPYVRYPMCYISAFGKTLSSIVMDHENETWEEFATRLHSLNLGWSTDELYVAERINQSSVEVTKHIRGVLDNGMASNRLDRLDWAIQDITYIDAHCPRPYSKYSTEIDNLINLYNEK